MKKDKPTERKQLILRLDKQLLKDIDHIAVDADEYRQQTVERLLKLGLERVKQQRTLQM